MAWVRWFAGAIPAEQVDRITGSKLKLWSGTAGQVDFQRADLRGAILPDVNLQDAKYDEKTKLPKDFEPEARGMIKVI